MDRFTQMHNDYLDPDRHDIRPEDEEPETDEPPKLPRNVRRRMRRLSNAISELQRKAPKRFPFPSLRETFKPAPEGDFKWEQDEAGDWHAWYCDDCHRYHKTAYGINMGRTNGKRWVEAWSVDQDGNSDFDGAYDERPDENEPERYPGSTPKEWPEFANYHLGGRHLWDYFMGWANYWEYSARQGKETLNQFYETPTDPVEFATKCIDAAWDNVKYLRSTLRSMKRKRKNRRSS